MRNRDIFLIFFCAVHTVMHAQSFTQTENAWIPDDGTAITFDMTVSGLPAVIDGSFGLESVCFNIDHTWDSDLDVRLVAPDGSSFLLVSGVGWGVQDFVSTCFNEGAAQFIYDGTAPFTGEWKPMGDLGVPNNGQDPNGVWKLRILDTWAFADQGYMIDWTLTFGDEPAEPFPFTVSNLPIVKINTGGQLILNEPKITAGLQIIDHGPGAVNNTSDTDYAYTGDILVELQGFTGPWMPKKNYDFDLIDAAGVQIDTPVLGMPAENDWILKSEYLDYSLMKNQIAYTMSRRMGRYAPRTVYCELLVDGEYMGVFSLTEKVKRDANRVEIAELDPEDIAGEELTGGYIFEINENYTPNDWESDYAPINDATCEFPVAYKMVEPRIEEIMPEQLDYIIAYVDSFEDALYGDDFLDTAIGYRRYISVKSFIDFMLVNECTSNYDSYGRSTFLYKEKNGQLFIGPPWDYDRGYLPWTTADWVWEVTHPMWPFPFWWSRFQEDTEYRNEVYCRWTDLRADVFSDAAFDQLIDSLYDHLGTEAPARNFQKWSELGVSDYHYFVEEVRTFLHDRLAWMDAALEPDAVPDPDASFTTLPLGVMNYQFIPAVTDADSYFWDFGDGTVSMEMSPVHNYTTAGDYTVQLLVSKYYGCQAAGSSAIQVITGVAESSVLPLQLHPNPTPGIVICSGVATDALIQVFDITGKWIDVPLQSGYIDLTGFPAGQYMVKVTEAGSVRTGLLVRD